MTEKEHFFWNKLLELAKEELTQATFDYYVLDTKLIKIQDNGPEISEDLVNSIFIPKVSQKTDGLGLGLSICKALAESQGGSLTAIRNEQGHLVMKLCLPMAVPAKDIRKNQ